jgi:high-affinity Fe2+/Pb2+ permease
LNAFFVTLREGVEAALIVSIVLGYIARIGASCSWTTQHISLVRDADGDARDPDEL